MENEKEIKEVKKEKTVKAKTFKVIPLKDHVIKHNAFYYELKKGVEIEVDVKFKQTLKTEKVTR